MEQRIQITIDSSDRKRALFHSEVCDVVLVAVEWRGDFYLVILARTQDYIYLDWIYKQKIFL